MEQHQRQRAWDLEFAVWRLEFDVNLRTNLRGQGSRVYGLGFRVWFFNIYRLSFGRSFTPCPFVPSARRMLILASASSLNHTPHNPTNRAPFQEQSFFGCIQGTRYRLQ